MIDKKCLVELDEVLNYLPEEELVKIPEKLRNYIKENKDKDYNWKYDDNKKLDEQNLSRDTIVMLSYINMEYLCTEEQKKLLTELHNYNEMIEEKKKAEKYDVNVFKKDNDEPKSSLIDVEKVENQKWYKKIVLFFKNLFKLQS